MQSLSDTLACVQGQTNGPTLTLFFDKLATARESRKLQLGQNKAGYMLLVAEM
jgi:hypothetical protein